MLFRIRPRPLRRRLCPRPSARASPPGPTRVTVAAAPGQAVSLDPGKPSGLSRFYSRGRPPPFHSVPSFPKETRGHATGSHASDRPILEYGDVEGPV